MLGFVWYKRGNRVIGNSRYGYGRKGTIIKIDFLGNIFDRRSFLVKYDNGLKAGGYHEFRENLKRIKENK